MYSFRNWNIINRILVTAISVVLIICLIFSGASDTYVLAENDDIKEIEQLTNEPESKSFDGYTVKISNGIDKGMSKDIEDADGAEELTDTFVSVDSPEDALEFANPEDIEYIEPNYYFTLDDAEGGTDDGNNGSRYTWPREDFPKGPPNDPQFGTWTTDTTTTDPSIIFDFKDYQWNLDMVNAPYAWKLGLRGQGVKLGLIDTGINTSGTDLNPYNYVKGINYYNSADGNAKTEDNSGHGTRVMSIIASQINNGSNIAGIVDNVQYVPLKVSNGATRLATGADVVKAIDYAQKNNIWVLNMSMGTYNAYAPLEEQVNYFAAHGGIIVASAGNDNCASMRYPAQYENSVGAGGVNSKGDRWHISATSGSNYNGAIDAAAPAQGILQYNGNKGTGNSYATAHISSLAVIAKQKSGGKINVVEFKKLLEQTCHQKEGYIAKNADYGFGLIDYEAFINAMTEENSSGKTPVLPYAITYKTNGGEISGTYKKFYDGTATITLPKSKVKKTGYTFNGWYTTSKFKGSPVTKIYAGDRGNKVFYAKWTAKKYKLTFNVNKGKKLSKNKQTKTVTYKKKVGTIPIPKRSGYRFVGWFTKKSGGTEYTKSKKHELAKNTTLYARWTKKKVMKFNGNGGSRYDYAKAVKQGKAIGKLPKAYRTGYTFTGWYTKKKGGKKLTNTYKLKNNRNLTVYAHWKKA